LDTRYKIEGQKNEIGSVIIKFTLKERLKEGYWNEGLFGE